ncbi:hypothetical protein [Sulfuracidifex tepidarius]|uniref:Uncharacterized protein n=1 Tax=Sulfuracidifex tepidarius TaxID=1294262 RepID=A0A510DTY4_9CREN|nr:hypothetical protein [Sulfuracidifex tepidarius]BBG23661.1 hypothetical protein IC006_0949 [Sulfuracidifex tepidarius]BBG26408.1 hypothetical protein IC007_0916 [Sulfuracidifex tepidarius]
MNKWLIILIIGIIILVIGVGLVFYGSSTLAGQIVSAENHLKSESYMTLPPTSKITIPVARGEIKQLLYESSEPVSVNTTVVNDNGIYIGELVGTTSSTTYTIVNNNTVPVSLRYDTITISGAPVDAAAAGVLLAIVGVIVAIVGGIVSLVRFLRNRSRPMG